MKEASACAGSCVEEDDDEVLVEGSAPPPAPICDSACVMALRKSPPWGGTDGVMPIPLLAFVSSVLLVWLVFLSWLT